MNYTPSQSRAVAEWFNSDKFNSRTSAQRMAIRKRAIKGWAHLTDEEQREALSVAASRGVVE